MNILLRTDNQLTRNNLEARLAHSGARPLDERITDAPGPVVVDLTAADAFLHICRLREQYPSTEIIAFGPHVDGEAFQKARAAGVTHLVARGFLL